MGEDLHFAGGDPPMVGTLNQKRFTRNDVDEASYVAIADFVRNDVHEKILECNSAAIIDRTVFSASYSRKTPAELA